MRPEETARGALSSPPWAMVCASARRLYVDPLQRPRTYVALSYGVGPAPMRLPEAVCVGADSASPALFPWYAARAASSLMGGARAAAPHGR